MRDIIQRFYKRFGKVMYFNIESQLFFFKVRHCGLSLKYSLTAFI